MSFWASNTTPLGDQLSVVSEKTRTTRQPNVEGQFDVIKNALIEQLREFARTNREKRWSIILIDLFCKSSTGITDTGTMFKNAMKGILPDYPDNNELTWIGEQLVEYFNEQNMTAMWSNGTGTLFLDWPKPDEIEE